MSETKTMKETTVRKEFALIEGPIFPSLIRFVLPILFALFLQSLYGAVDLWVVGKFATTADVSGVSTGSQIMQTITMVVTGLSMGVTILVGQEIGRKEPKMAGRTIGAGIVLFALVAVFMTIGMTGFAKGWANLMNAPEEAYANTVSYVRICGAGSVFIIAYNIIGSVFRGIGDSKTPLLTVGIACVFNIAGDLFCVRGLGLGAAGAAYATVAAQMISVLISFVIIRKKKDLPIAFSPSFIRFDRKIVANILRLGIPIALQELLVGISFMVILMMVNKMGVVVSAGVGVAEKVCGFIMLIPSAFSQSMSAFTAQNVGANRIDRAKKGYKIAILTSMGINVFVFWFAFFHGEILTGIFANDPAVVTAGALYLKAYAIDCMLTPLLFCSYGYFGGRERTTFVSLNGIIGAFCVRIPVVLLVIHFMENPTPFNVGLATPCSTVVQDLLCIWMYIRVNREDRKEENARKQAEKIASLEDVIAAEKAEAIRKRMEEKDSGQ